MLDLGTGTGVVAKALAERYPEAEVVGIDLSPAMIEEAARQLPAELAGHVRFEVGDAAALDVPDGSVRAVVLSNMIPFFGELARVTAPDGTLVLSFSRGAETPIYVPSDRLRRELGRRGFAEFAEFSAEPAIALSREEGLGSGQRIVRDTVAPVRNDPGPRERASVHGGLTLDG